MPISVDLVLPCYNPPTGWAANLVQRIARFQELMPEIELHVIVVNDGSTRGVSATDIALLSEQLPHSRYLSYAQNRGKGYALRHGVQHARQELCLFTDIDFPYEEASVAAILQALLHGVDVAVGARDTTYYAQVPRGRIIISKLLRRSTRYLLGLAVSDTQCGLKGFNRRGREVFLATDIDRYLFDLEFIFLASRPAARLRVQPVPVKLKPGIVFSRMSPQVLLTEGGSFVKLLMSRLA